MGPLAQSDGHDAPELLDELVPGVAAVSDDVVVGSNTRLESQLSRRNCQMFSVGLSSGHLAGRGRMVMFLGSSSLAVMCQPA